MISCFHQFRAPIRFWYPQVVVVRREESGKRGEESGERGERREERRERGDERDARDERDEQAHTEIDHNKFTAQRLACSSHTQLAQIVEGIIDNKGEGVIMRKSGSRYVHGRSSSLIKMKV